MLVEYHAEGVQLGLKDKPGAMLSYCHSAAVVHALALPARSCALTRKYRDVPLD
jgi:hypothetical protein